MAVLHVPNTTVLNESFSKPTVDTVWQKASVVPGYDPQVWRKDTCGAWIKRDEYGLISEHGWEIDHIMPVAAGGSDVWANLQPLQWRNNRHKSDSYPNWSCLISAKVA